VPRSGDSRLWLHHFFEDIANRRQGFFRIGGNVRYAGIDAQEMAKEYKGEIVYNAEGAFSGLAVNN